MLTHILKMSESAMSQFVSDKLNTQCFSCIYQSTNTYSSYNLMDKLMAR